MIKIVKPDFIWGDQRGNLTQLVHDGWHQVNVITSNMGAERGGHYHKLNREMFYIVKGKLYLEVESGMNKESYDFKEGDLFVIEPYVLHSFFFQEDTILVSLYDRGVELEEGKKDIYLKEER